MSASPLLTPYEFTYLDPRKSFSRTLKIIGRVKQIVRSEDGTSVILEDLDIPDKIIEVVIYRELYDKTNIHSIAEGDFVITYGVGRWWRDKKYLVAKWIRKIPEAGLKYYLKRKGQKPSSST
ncbi:MAG: hypothetical protein ACTSX9_00305 [Candidatus Njordarchaeales archaeon]